MKKCVLAALCIPLLSSALFCETTVSGGAFTFSFHSEINRTLGYLWSLETGAGVELNDVIFVRGGVSAGQSDVFNVSTFLRTGVKVPISIPLSVDMIVIYSNWPDYHAQYYALMPVVTLSGYWAGISVGGCLRGAFYRDTDIAVEPEFVFSAYLSLIHMRGVNVRVVVSNFSEYIAGNTGSYWFTLETVIRLTNHFVLSGSLGLYQSGSIGLTAVPSGGGFNGGVRFEF